MTQLRAEYDTASDERRENRNVGQNRGVKWDAPRPDSGEVDGEKCESEGRGHERNDPKAFPDRVGPERQNTHANSVS